MGFGHYLMAILLPPVYFMLRGKWTAAIVNGFFFLISLPLMFLVVGFFIWAFCVGHATWDLVHAKQEQAMQRQATLIAQSMRENE